MAKKCVSCGAWVDDRDKFCEYCGASLADAVYQQPEVVEAEIIAPSRRYESPAADAREVRERLVGTNTAYYLPRFEKIETLKSYTDWNWAAFLFTNLWMIYRKMYALAAVATIAIFIVNTVDSILLTMLCGIGFGFFGNFLYMRDINNRTDQALNMQPEDREAYIQKYSGTSRNAVIIFLVVWALLSMIF